MDSMQKTKSDYLILKDSQVWFLSFYSTPNDNPNYTKQCPPTKTLQTPPLLFQ